MTCESLFAYSLSAPGLEQRLVEAAHAEPFAISFNASVAINEHFAPVLGEVRALTDLLLQDPEDMSGEAEMLQTRDAIQKVKETHARIEDLVNPGVMKRLLYAYRASSIVDDVAKLTEEIQVCHAHARECSVRIVPKIGKLKAHVLQIQSVVAKLERMNAELVSIQSNLPNVVQDSRVNEDLAHSLETKHELIDSEIQILQNHIGLVRVKINVATQVHVDGSERIDVLVEAAKNLGRPYVSRQRSNETLIAQQAMGEIVTLEQKRLLLNLQQARQAGSEWPRKEIRALQQVPSWQALNAVLDVYFSTRSRNEYVQKDLEFILAGRRITEKSTPLIARLLLSSLSVENSRLLEWLNETSFSRYQDSETTKMMIKMTAVFVDNNRGREILKTRTIEASHLDLLEELYSDESAFAQPLSSYDLLQISYRKRKVLEIVDRSRSKQAEAFLRKVAAEKNFVSTGKMTEAEENIVKLGFNLTLYRQAVEGYRQELSQEAQAYLERRK